MVAEEVAEIRAGEEAAMAAIERAQTHPDALYDGFLALKSTEARRAYMRVVQQPLEAQLASAGKAAAVGLYNAGVVSREATERAFERHPAWRHA